ncbi:DHHC zinc finger domain protein [Opisthorchis viverrini]|uniref:Palmitoyltransferase n=2 Tax=Opisthorchis viverrini TaxID=6198 RepID=A0A075A227_OPIVI|nr:hypothetical protein T265_00438 [Opisthorchis viverrini]KER33758.1 hypothetical protein T265_00438 [Opisthorchis viverrini]OON20201.1 DHHC zinc finger domain protein [Opisthorchis viverrini]
MFFTPSATDSIGMRKWAIRQCVRILHISVCLAIMLPLLLRPSALHRMIFAGTDIIHGVSYVVCFATSLVAYMIASCADPGYLTHEKARLFRHRRGNLSDCDGDEVISDKPFPGEHNSGAECCTMEKRSSGRDSLSKSVESFPVVVPEVDMQVAAPVLSLQRDLKNLVRSCLTCPVSGWFLSTSNAATTYEDFVLNLSVPVRFCKHCLLEQPLRCRHCPECNRCVIKFDHHCPWLANCVGERNHSAFVVFLTLQMLILWWTMYLAWSSIVPNYLWTDWFRLNVLFLIEIIVLMIIGIPLTVLLGFHTYLALASKTTWETVAYEKIAYLQHLDDHANPFNQGLARNCFAFCCSRYPLGWDRIYAEAVGQINTEQASFPASGTLQPTGDPSGKLSKPTETVYIRLQPEPPTSIRESAQPHQQAVTSLSNSSNLNCQIHDITPGLTPVVCLVNQAAVDLETQT